jgi:mycofactocin system glycosyltransferase
MEEFGFALAESTSLREERGGLFVISRRPLRVLRLNDSLYRLLGHIRAGGPPGEFARDSGLDEGRLLKTLLSLTAGGYLRLDSIAVPDDYPDVSVVIPVKDQPGELAGCLEALHGLDYPKEKLEIIVVDDGSLEAVAPSGVRVIRQDVSRGPAAGRNTGAGAARGDIIAFLDADCVPHPAWLKELVPFFRAADIGAVGGYVEGHDRKRLLDRYEAVASSLNQGSSILMAGDTASTFYVPTANLLVTRDAFFKTGGFKDGMRLGEDVDFCWRLRTGNTLLYVPCGRVAHKHRHRLLPMLRRRAEYGTSEAVLYRAHRDKKKTFYISIYAGLSFIALALALLLLNPYPLTAVPLVLGIDLGRKSGARAGSKMVSFGQIAGAVLRSYPAFYYAISFHLVRYYFILLAGLGFLYYPVWLVGLLMLLLTSIADYRAKRPRLIYPVYLFFYTLEHLAYQAGVFWGCLKLGYFGSYLPKVSFSYPTQDVS